MDFIYTVPIVESCLSQDDCIIQIANALEQLQTVTTDVFQNINQRINSNMTKTQNIAKRIEICNDKVSKLTGANRAIKVYSNAKYPGMDLCKNYISIFNSESTRNVSNDESKIIINKSIPFNEKESQDRLEFYHVKASNPDKLKLFIEKPHPKGLGPLPDDIEYVNSLILSNRNETVYCGTSKMAHQKSGYSNIKNNQTKNEDTLQAAPYSILNREIGLKKSVDSYLYSPLMGEVPELHVPQDLPHLTGIADDMKFYSETESIIAPSAAATTSTDQITTEPSEKTKIDTEPIKISTNSENIPSTATKSEVGIIKDETPKVVTVESVPPPPPPPPPPAMMISETPKSKDTTETDSVVDKIQSKSKTKSQPPDVDNRANLMDAIRKAGGIGGAKLRSIQSEEDKPKAAGGHNDLMADLHAKLSMRRKGISGNKANPAEGTILGAIYAMSPTVVDNPEDTTSNCENSSGDDDWD